MSWFALALVGAGAAAATSILGKIGVAAIPSNLAVLIRTVVVLLFVGVLVVARGEQSAMANVRGRDWVFLSLSGLATGVSWLAFFKALQMAPASWVVPIDKLSLALTVVLAAAFLGETITLHVAIGVGLMVAGALFIAWRQ